MPPKNKKSPATRPLSVLQQKNKILNSGKKKPAWDVSVFEHIKCFSVNNIHDCYVFRTR